MYQQNQNRNRTGALGIIAVIIGLAYWHPGVATNHLP